MQSGSEYRARNVLRLQMASVCWWFYISKILELFDTLFFVLRKKQSQITFLHVYHHSTMIWNWWIAAKYVAGGQRAFTNPHKTSTLLLCIFFTITAFFQGIINSGVHVIMYGYYALAAMGPEVQRYLWWKKYITKLQLVNT